MDLVALNAVLLGAAEEEHHAIDIGIEPWVVGALALAALMLLLIGLLAFGKGREHT